MNWPCRRVGLDARPATEGEFKGGCRWGEEERKREKVVSVDFQFFIYLIPCI